MNVKIPIAIALLILFLAANVGILYKFRGRFSGYSPNPRNSKFAEEAKRGSDAFERGDYEQAIVAWDEAIRIDPHHSNVHRWRGDASLNKHEFDKSLSEYDEAIRLDPKNGMAYCCRGAASTGNGEFDKAIASFDEAIRLDPQIANLSFYKRYRTAAESLRPNARNSKFAEEAKRGSRALPPNPQDPKFAEEAKRGLDVFQRADYDQAIAAFDKLIRLDPNHSEAHRWRGDASLNKHEFDKALSEYDEAIRLDPKNGMAYSGRGAASTEKGDFDKAIASFDEAIRLDPKIANMPFYKRYRAVAEAAWSLGLLVVVPLLTFGLCLFLAFAAWPTVRHRKPEVDKDF